jgi:hypothetical protein
MPMSLTKSMFKVVAINVGLTLFLLGLLAVVPAMWSDLRMLAGKLTDTDVPGKSERAALPNYRGLDWADRHFYEYKKMGTEYYDFIGWRRKPFQGQTVTIDRDGYRRHATATAAEAEVWMFGGSTMWGTGVPDDATIPAFLEQVSGKRTFNFGESAYVAHQNLNLLMKQYVLGGRPQTVLFYDGVNEVAHKCRRELDFYATGEQGKIRERMLDDGSHFLALFKPLLKHLPIDREKNRSQWYDCNTNPAKAQHIVDNLVQDWMVAKALVESHGGKFIAVLQPVAYVGQPNTAYLQKKDLNDDLKMQYSLLYSMIRKALAEHEVPYHDLTAVFDGHVQYYIDFCHVVPEGNRQVASRLAPLL